MIDGYDSKGCNALQRPFYRPVEAALRWCNLTQHEGTILQSIGTDNMYDPSAARNEATATIASATVAAGCEVDADTVRKYLKEAAERFGTTRCAGR